MITPPHYIANAPEERPLMIWDGQCGFCAYWIERWGKQTSGRLAFEAYQEAKERFPEIEVREFQRAVHLVDQEGRAFRGAAAVFRGLDIARRGKSFWYRLYRNSRWFAGPMECIYKWVARHRDFCFRLTKFLFGSDPHSPRPFWAIYLGVILYFLYILL